jgi:hypothetical protein
MASSSGIREKPSDVVYSEDVVLVFSSSKPSYMPGERAIFYIDILNLRNFSISRVDFSLNVKALSLLGLNVFSMEDCSTRTFAPGKFERIRVLPSDAIEVTLPPFIPPGFYALELSARPSALKAPKEASIIIYIAPSTFAITAPLAALTFSSAVYVTLALGASVDVDKLPRNPAFRRLALLAYSIDVKSQEADEALKKAFINFSIGQKFVFLGLCALIMASLPLMLRLESFANDLAILAYLSLTIGVINLLLEMLKPETIKPETIDLKSRPSMRLVLSLTVLILLTYYYSSKILAIIIVAFTLYAVMRVKLKS